MGDRDTYDDAIAARRRFIRRLRAHEDVHTVDFSRDGFHLVIVELEPGVEFRDQWRRTATHLGYTVEQLEAAESRPDWPEDVWILRLAETGESTDRSTWTSTVRHTVARPAKTLRDRLSD